MSTKFINYITSNAFVDKYQSTYFPQRSTETTLTLNINDILIYLDNKAPRYIVLLDLSSDFDTLDHNVFLLDLMKLLYTFETTVGLCILFHLEYLDAISQCWLKFTYICKHRLLWLYTLDFLNI